MGLPAVVLLVAVAAQADTLSQHGVQEANATVVVLDLAGTGIADGQVQLLNGSIVDAVTAVGDLDVVSQEDIRRMVEFEAEKQTLGCDTDSCLAEIAGALGADYVVYGRTGRLGERYVLQLNLFDSQGSRAVAREELSGDSLEDIADSIRPAVARLFNPDAIQPGPPPTQASEPSTPSIVPTAMLWTGLGVAAVGIGVAASAGVITAGMEADLSDVDAPITRKNVAADLGPVVFGVAIAGGALAIVGLGVAGAGMVVE